MSACLHAKVCQVLKLYFPFIYNPKIGTETSMGKFASHLIDFSIFINNYIMMLGIPQKKRVFLIYSGQYYTHI